MTDAKKSIDHTFLAAKQIYEAPAIEEVMTPAELERAVHYAGEPTGPNNP